ncbi:hypothetical protein EDC01DRAFT_636944 [Geopyxis carbonaria]|nr:hypothetical protein EDC01DRAFT_636944 [Geopyxis carbonaria]
MSVLSTLRDLALACAFEILHLSLSLSRSDFNPFLSFVLRVIPWSITALRLWNPEAMAAHERAVKATYVAALVAGLVEWVIWRRSRVRMEIEKRVAKVWKEFDDRAEDGKGGHKEIDGQDNAGYQPRYRNEDETDDHKEEDEQNNSGNDDEEENRLKIEIEERVAKEWKEFNERAEGEKGDHKGEDELNNVVNEDEKEINDQEDDKKDDEKNKGTVEVAEGVNNDNEPASEEEVSTRNLEDLKIPNEYGKGLSTVKYWLGRIERKKKAEEAKKKAEQAKKKAEEAKKKKKSVSYYSDEDMLC